MPTFTEITPIVLVLLLEYSSSAPLEFKLSAVSTFDAAHPAPAQRVSLLEPSNRHQSTAKLFHLLSGGFLCTSPTNVLWAME